MTSKLDHALSLAAKGFRVFPLAVNGKVPAIKNWPDLATTHAATITDWWTKSPNRNIGVATGDGLLVIDVDVKNGAKGAQTYAALDMLHDIPPTYTVTTPTGGTHVYLTSGQDVRNSASKLGDGVDVRGAKGFVVGPGSTIGHQDYVADHPLVGPAPCPLSIVELAGRGRDQDGADGPIPVQAQIELDTPRAQERATQYLTSAEPAVEGAGGDAHTYAVACRVRDFGISEPVALELMSIFWAERCVSSLSPQGFQEFLADKVSNAYQYAEKPAGNADPAAEFEVVPESRGRLYLKKFKDVALSRDNPYLIDGYIDQAAFSVIYGESHTGKTFVALDMSFAVASGTPWNGRRVRQGAVVYIAAEGGRGIEKRVVALQQRCSDVPFAVIPCSVNLMGGARSDIDAIVQLIDAFTLETKMPVSLIVVDTLSRAMAGANENASEDMTAFVKAVDRLREKTGAHVMVVHHAGKDTSKGARGHSSLRAATDTELEVADNALAVRKQRDGEHAAALRFRLKTVDLGTDADARPITSCVIEWSGGASEFVDVPLTPDEQDCFDALMAACEKSGKAWATAPEIVAVYPVAARKAESPSERTIRRWLSALVDKGAARRMSRNTWSPT